VTVDDRLRADDPRFGSVAGRDRDRSRPLAVEQHCRSDRERREELYAELTAEATEHIDRIGIVWPNVIQGRQNSVRNFEVYPNSRIVAGAVWLDQ
jgi:hypothetical protein